MSKKQLIKLHFQSPLHLSKGKGNQESSYEILHSDTLKSAIYYNALMLFGEAIIGEDEKDCPFLSAFKLTSAFPFYQDKLFFPKPQLPLPDIEGLEASKQRKAKKKIKLLNLAYFEALINGNLDSIALEDLHLKGSVIDGMPQLKTAGRLTGLTNGKEYQPIETDFMKAKVQQKVMVPRAEAVDTDTYYMERIYFRENAGLFFWIEYDEAKFTGIQPSVVAALQLLGENGIGSDRNTGNGHFKVTFEDGPNLTVPTDADKQINMSLFCPEETEISQVTDEKSAFSLIKRGGFIASPTHVDHITYRKKSIYMIQEGAVFPNTKMEGKLVNLAPDSLPAEETPLTHPVWRDGRAIFIPVKA